MTYVVGSARVTSAGGVTSITDSAFVLSGGPNRKVFAAVGTEDAFADGWTHGGGVTFNGVAMTRLVPTASDLVVETTRRRLSVWRIDEANLPAAGTYSVVATLADGANSPEGIGLIVWEHTGLAAGAASDVETHAPGSGQTVTTNEITPTGADDIIVVGFHSGVVTTAVPDTSDYTAVERVEAVIQTNQCSMYLSTADAVAAGTYSAGITWDPSGVIGQCVAALSPAAAGGNTGSDLRTQPRGIGRGIGRGLA
jgi:hypothetical protein